MYYYADPYIKCWSDVYLPYNTTELVMVDGLCNIPGRPVFDLSFYTNLRSISISNSSFNSMTTLNLAGLNELKSISISESPFNSMTTLNLTGLSELRSITIGDGSFTKVTIFYITGNSKLQNLSIGDNSLSGVTTLDLTGKNEMVSITIGSNAFTNANALDLTGKIELVSISIGDNCFANVGELRIEELLKLENLTIGMNSFTQKKNNAGGNSNRKFYLRNCPLLKEVRIGRYSFSDYMYSYIENLESLKLLQFGDVSETSYNFYIAEYASFESDRMNDE